MEANQTGATNIQGAATRLSSLLQSEQQPPTEESNEVQQDSQEPEEQVTQEAASEETTNEAKEPEGQPEAEEVETYKVKVSGEEVDVTLDDLKKGYMMESDYRKKTSSLASDREALEAKQADIDAQLGEAKSLIDLELENLNSPEMLELKADDPEAYLAKMDKVQKKRESYEKLKSKRETEQRERFEKLVEKERENLFVAFPEWRDDAKAMKSGIEERSAVLSGLGFTESELSQMIDSRVWVLADKALKYDALMAKALDDKKSKAKPKTNRAGTASDSQDKQSDAKRAMRDRLRQSGNVKDAAALLRMN